MAANRKVTKKKAPARPRVASGSRTLRTDRKSAPARKKPAAVAMTDDQFADAKQAALERSLGPMHKTVLHAIIPFYLGGGLDLYPFMKCIPGTVFATQELIGRSPKERTKPGKRGHFELVACLPPKKTMSDKRGMSLINGLLNPTAMYAFEVPLNPGETAEIPSDDGGTTAMLLDLFGPLREPLCVGKEEFHLLLCMAIHPTELEYARKRGTSKLIGLLKQHGAYPYSDLSRKPVV